MDSNRWLSLVSFIVGLWLIAAPFFLGYAGVFGSGVTNIDVATTNDMVVGFIVAVLAFASFNWRATAGWLPWVVAVLGLWEIAAPFILGYAALGAAMTNGVISGLVILAFSGARALGLGTTQRYGPSYSSEIKERRDRERDRMS